jgi:hypothetical protein
VFATKIGTPLDERNVLRRFQKILALIGLPKMRLHDLRHSAVAILIAQGVHIKAISELLGHSSVAFTLQVYGHLLEETKRETSCASAAPPPIPKLAFKKRRLESPTVSSSATVSSRSFLRVVLRCDGPAFTR